MNRKELESLIGRTLGSPKSNSDSPEVRKFLRRLGKTAEKNGIRVDVPPGEPGRAGVDEASLRESGCPGR